MAIIQLLLLLGFLSAYDEGIGIDPFGVTATVDEGSGLDPHGGPRTTSFGDEGVRIDPNG